MLALPSAMKVWVAADGIDMRKGFCSLAAMIQKDFRLDPKSSHLFVFFSRNGKKVKTLYWDRNGFALWYKSLSDGRFRPPRVTGKPYTISVSDLTLLLEGIDLNHSQRSNAI